MENDRLRDRAAKLLQKHGCSRVQRSVFVAAYVKPRDLEQLKAALDRLMARGPVSPQDSLLLMPLPEEVVAQTAAIGCANNILAALAPLPLKILL